MSIIVPTQLEALRSHAIRLDEEPHDYDALLEMVGERAFVLLGEATHGTHEFYRMRAEITRRLIEECGFDAVAVEADWPDAYRLARYVRGQGHDATATAAFADFQRFPTWMWRNHDVLDFVRWLHDYNAGVEMAVRVGFYGLDMYSLYRSADAVVEYLQDIDPEQAEIARQRYAALDHVRDPQRYGYEAATGMRPSCRDDAIELMLELARKSTEYLDHDGADAADEQFYAERNARIVISAETYYRAMFGSRINTWNLRDLHMTDTLFALREHLRRQGRMGRIVVWAHNTHVGDARATEAGRNGEFNIGQLVRERAGAENVLSVGFTTYTGRVAAACEWDAPVEHRWVRPALIDTYEHLFYTTRLDRFFLPLQGPDGVEMPGKRLERAIGVIYRPETERNSHYFYAAMPGQFDAVFHLDETSAVEPFDVDRGTWHPHAEAAVSATA